MAISDFGNPLFVACGWVVALGEKMDVIANYIFQ